MDFVPFFAGKDRVMRRPAGQGRYPPVTRDDLADCAVAVLTSGGAHDGRTYELTGPELLTLAEIAERMSTYTGQEYRYEDETIDEAWASRRPSSAPDWEIEGSISHMWRSRTARSTCSQTTWSACRATAHNAGAVPRRPP